MTAHTGSTDTTSHEPRGANARGQQRREELLQIAVEYLLEEGLNDFSVRQIAKRAGTSHRILLYHFGSTAQLLREALTEIRRPLLDQIEAAAADPLTLITGGLATDSPAARVLVQGMLQAALDPDRYGDIGHDYNHAYLPIIERNLPSHITGQARHDLAHLVLCAFRGALLDVRTTGDPKPAKRALAYLQATVSPAHAS